jgi:hypothetical protein
MAALKRRLESERNDFRKQSNDSSSALRESYCVAHLFPKGENNFFQWRIRKKYLHYDLSRKLNSF